MSTKQGVQKCNRTAAAPAAVRKPLPMDLQLEIAARCDVTTIIRCATATKFLRRAMLKPAFRRRLALQAAAGGGGFDPALLFGVSYLAYRSGMVPLHRIIRAPSSIQLHARLQACSLHDSFEPVASRDHLLLLRRLRPLLQPPTVELRVCDTTNGHVITLPNVIAVSYGHVFLSVSNAEAGVSYELIVTDRDFRFQIFSSKHGQWGGVRKPSVSGHPYAVDASSRARVIGRTVYWLCLLNDRRCLWDGVIALDVDAEAATTVELPLQCFSAMMPYKHDKHLLLASVHGRLSLLVAEIRGISMWTLAPTSSPKEATATWSWELVIGREEIEKPVGLASSPLSFVLEEFGERSGAIIVRVNRKDLLRLDLGTKVVTRLNNPEDASVACLFLHETDLVSLIKKSL